MFSGGELPPKGLSWDSLGLKTWGWLSGTTGIGGGSEQKILKGGRQFELSNKKEVFLRDRGLLVARPSGTKIHRPKNNKNGMGGQGQNYFGEDIL